MCCGAWAWPCRLCRGAHTLEAAGLAFSTRDEAAVAEYRLATVTELNVRAAIDAALDERDTELAQSLVELAKSRGIAIDPTQSQRIQAALDASGGQALADLDGFTTGDTSSEAALAGALGADFSGYGDIRDLYEQIDNYQQGKPVDDLVVGLAAAGLALTGATIVSLGSASPAKAGVSVVKSARRAGKLSPALTRQVGKLAADAIDRKALDTLSDAVRRFDIGAARTAAVAVVRPNSLKAIATLGEDIATVGRATGYRGMMQTLKLAKSSDEVGQVAKLSTRFGTRTRGALALIGGAALSLPALLSPQLLGWPRVSCGFCSLPLQWRAPPSGFCAGCGGLFARRRGCGFPVRGKPADHDERENDHREYA